MLSSPTQFLRWGYLWGVMEGNSADDEPHTLSNRIAANHTHLLQPSHWAQIILCFRDPCSFPPSSLRLECASSPVHHSPFSLIPPTSYITKTRHHFPRSHFIFPLHHRHLSTLSLSLKTILRDLPPFPLPISHQSYLTE